MMEAGKVLRVSERQFRRHRDRYDLRFGYLPCVRIWIGRVHKKRDEVAAGTNSRTSSSRFAASALFNWLTAVRLPPGLLKLATRPDLTGSVPVENDWDDHCSTLAAKSSGVADCYDDG
jgi:hypothetical protein